MIELRETKTATFILWVDQMMSYSQLGLYLTDVLGNVSVFEYHSWCMCWYFDLLFNNINIMFASDLVIWFQFANDTSLSVIRKLACTVTFPGTVLVHLRWKAPWLNTTQSQRLLLLVALILSGERLVRCYKYKSRGQNMGENRNWEQWYWFDCWLRQGYALRREN